MPPVPSPAEFGKHKTASGGTHRHWPELRSLGERDRRAGRDVVWAVVPPVPSPAESRKHKTASEGTGGTVMTEKPFQSPAAFDWNCARLVHRDYLPHVRQENVIYFVTFRLGDSLAAERVAELRQRRDAWLKLNPPPHKVEQEQQYRRIWTVRVENLMDAGFGRCELRDPECREMLERSLRHDDRLKYQLGEFVIMPNHVHALLRMLPGYELSDTLKAWKSVSARRMGKRLGRTGSFWMEECFDHAVRDDQSLNRFVDYIRQNPRNLAPGTFTLGCGSLML